MAGPGALDREVGDLEQLPDVRGCVGDAELPPYELADRFRAPQPRCVPRRTSVKLVDEGLALRIREPGRPPSLLDAVLRPYPALGEAPEDVMDRPSVHLQEEGDLVDALTILPVDGAEEAKLWFGLLLFPVQALEFVVLDLEQESVSLGKVPHMASPLRVSLCGC